MICSKLCLVVLSSSESSFLRAFCPLRTNVVAFPTVRIDTVKATPTVFIKYWKCTLLPVSFCRLLLVALRCVFLLPEFGLLGHLLTGRRGLSVLIYKTEECVLPCRPLLSVLAIRRHYPPCPIKYCTTSKVGYDLNAFDSSDNDDNLNNCGHALLFKSTNEQIMS